MSSVGIHEIISKIAFMIMNEFRKFFGLHLIVLPNLCVEIKIESSLRHSFTLTLNANLI